MFKLACCIDAYQLTKQKPQKIDINQQISVIKKVDFRN